MADYSFLEHKAREAVSSGFEVDVIPCLIDTWLDEYVTTAGSTEIVETTLDGFSYLFDIARGTLIAAWGISRGKRSHPRPSSRMKGHPLSAGPRYHRGHAIAHTLGGEADINLVPQLGNVNIGPFRQLENRAILHPGALYFTYWKYDASPSQVPVGVDQGLLVPGQPADIRLHGN